MDFPAPRHRPPSSVVLLEPVDPAELRLDRARERPLWSSCAWAPSTQNTAQSSFQKIKVEPAGICSYLLVCSLMAAPTSGAARSVYVCNQHIYVYWPDRYVGRRATAYPDPLADLLRYNLSTVRAYLLEEELTLR